MFKETHFIQGITTAINIHVNLECGPIGRIYLPVEEEEKCTTDHKKIRVKALVQYFINNF
jgi:hypothetical protein